MEQFIPYIQLGVTVIGLIFIGYQTYIQKTRIESQAGIIEDIKSWKNLFDPDYLKRWQTIKDETHTLEFKKEKDILTESYNTELEKLKTASKSNEEEFKAKLNELLTSEQKLNETTKELNTVRRELTLFQMGLNVSNKIGAEYLQAAIKLTALYIDKNDWDEFTETHFVKGKDQFKARMKDTGEEYYKDMVEKQEAFYNSQLTFSHFGKNRASSSFDEWLRPKKDNDPPKNEDQ